MPESVVYYDPNSTPVANAVTDAGRADITQHWENPNVLLYTHDGRDVAVPTYDGNGTATGEGAPIPTGVSADLLALLEAVPRRYLKVASGVVVEMSQAEKDLVDAPLAVAAEDARQAAIKAEAVARVAAYTGDIYEQLYQMTLAISVLTSKIKGQMTAEEQAALAPYETTRDYIVAVRAEEARLTADANATPNWPAEP